MWFVNRVRSLINYLSSYRKEMKEDKASELVAFEFDSLESLESCIKILVEQYPNIEFKLPGRMDVIVPSRDETKITHMLDDQGIEFQKLDVVSAADLDPEQLTKLRSSKGKSRVKLEEKQKRIKELKTKLGM